MVLWKAIGETSSRRTGQKVVIMREWMASYRRQVVSGKITFPAPGFRLWESSGDQKEKPELSFVIVTCLQYAVNQLALNKLFLFDEAGGLVFYQLKTCGYSAPTSRIVFTLAVPVPLTK